MSRSQSNSEYYPRRAGRFSWLWYRWFRLKHGVRLWRLVERPEGLNDKEKLLSVLLPGYIFVALGYRKVGISILTGFCIASWVSLAAIGLPLAAFCLFFMLSVQVTCILELIVIRAKGMIAPLNRIGLALLLVIGLIFLVYAPLNQFVRAWIVLPLAIRDGMVLVNPRWDASEVGAGDAIAYRIDAERGSGYQIQEGILYGRILASEGDRVVFSADHYEINGIAHASQRWMPSNGELTIEPDSWFIWADLRVRNDPYNTVNVPDLILSRTAIVSNERFVGKLYRNWFGRDQSHLHQDSTPVHEPIFQPRIRDRF